MSLPAQILQIVTTYQAAQLGYLTNLTPVISTLNTKFKYFEKETAQLGDTVNLQLPFRFRGAAGLVAAFNGIQERFQPLSCDQAFNVSSAYDDQDFTFNIRHYMDDIGKGMMYELAQFIESNVCLDAISAVPVNTVDQNGQTVPTGALKTESGPYLFYGDGVTPINSYEQLQAAVELQKDFGAVREDYKFYIPNVMVPQIIGSGLNQFATKRNDQIAQSWEIGTFGTPPVKYYASNLLPIQNAGYVGNNSLTLTVVSTNDPTGAAITQITCSGATGTTPNAINSGDLGYFLDNVSGQPNMRYLTFMGHAVSNNKVQFRATSTVGSVGGNVTFNVTPILSSTPGPNQNLNNNIVPGMQIKFLPSHRAGVLTTGNPWFLAMPQLPTQTPYPTANKVDEKTNVSIRTYYGVRFGTNFRGLINDCIWASTLVPEYSRRICFPLSFS